MGVPTTASEHPSSWKHGYPIYHPASREALRTWLGIHHATERGAWIASWRRSTGRPTVPYQAVVEEALCVGWIDSTVNLLDDERRLQLLTPRRPRSSWTRLNRARVARLEREGLMTEAGLRAIEVAQANGWWTIHDPVDDLQEPEDLAAALGAVPRARAHWDAFPPSARKAMLWSVVSAMKPETRARRVQRIVDAAAEGRRALG